MHALFSAECCKSLFARCILCASVSFHFFFFWSFERLASSPFFRNSCPALIMKTSPHSAPCQYTKRPRAILYVCKLYAPSMRWTAAAEKGGTGWVQFWRRCWGLIGKWGWTVVVQHRAAGCFLVAVKWSCWLQIPSTDISVVRCSWSRAAWILPKIILFKTIGSMAGPNGSHYLSIIFTHILRGKLPALGGGVFAPRAAHAR